MVLIVSLLLAYLCYLIYKGNMASITMGLFRLVPFTVIFIPLCIALYLSSHMLELFNKIPLSNFLFSTRWSPFDSSPSFGVAPLLLGTLLITVISVSIAVPVATLSAIFVTQFAPRLPGRFLKYIFEIPASIPSVVYGYFGALKVAPTVVWAATALGLEVSYENALTAGITIAMMIAPIIFYMTCDLISSVPKPLQYAVLAMGVTRTEFVFTSILPYISSGILGIIFLAIARVIGETMIVVLVVGLNANFTINPLQDVTTITAQIVSLINGDNNAQSPQVLAAHALSLTLFIITILLSLFAIHLDLRAKRRYKTLYS